MLTQSRINVRVEGAAAKGSWLLKALLRGNYHSKRDPIDNTLYSLHVDLPMNVREGHTIFISEGNC